MTTQVSESLLYNGHKYRMDNTPLESLFERNGNRPPFMARMTACWRGYIGTWSLFEGRLRLDSLKGYIAKVPLVEIAGGTFRHNIDYEDQSLCTKVTLNELFPDATGPVFADWFSGEITAPLNDEVARFDDEVAIVERTLKLVFEGGLLVSEDVVLKHLPTRRDIENGLASPDVNVRRKFAKSLESSATPEQIARGILDEDSRVRQSFMQAAYSNRARFSFTPEQLERVLTDESAEVRRYATMFENCQPTPSQLERALLDKSPVIRCNMANSFGDQLTPAQIERGLTDEDGEVRAAFASMDTEFTPAQIERGLTDEFEEVRYWFTCNEDIELTPVQIQRCLKDEYELIPLEIVSRYDCDLIEVPKLDPIFEKMFEINGTKVRRL